jgi:Uma2 family endonuclease
MSTATETLLTAEQYRLLPEEGRNTELVRGRVIERPPPALRHDYYCAAFALALRTFLKGRDLGRVACNVHHLVTHRNPDTVRRADVCYFGPARSAAKPPVMPDLIFEVRAPKDNWATTLTRVVDYLFADVAIVGILDPRENALVVYRGDWPETILRQGNELTLPELFGPEFRVPVRRFFE